MPPGCCGPAPRRRPGRLPPARLPDWEVLMLKEELLKILACPKCKGTLEYDRENGKLSCEACRLRYPIRDDIPIMLVEEAESF